MIIYFEGVDGSGKTTLLKRIKKELIKKYNNKYKIIDDANKFIPTKPTAPDRITELTLFLKIKVMEGDNSTIYLIDRGPISDIVYRMFDDYKPVMTLDKLLTVELFNKEHTLIVYCDTDDAKKNMLKRGDNNPIAIKYHHIIRKVFKMVMSTVAENGNATVVPYNYSKDDIGIATTILLDDIDYMLTL